MTQVYRLIFVADDGQKVAYDLSAGSLLPVNVDFPLPAGVLQILVLPAAVSLSLFD